MSTQPNESTEPTGMWAPYVPAEIGEKLDQLEEAGPFVLVEAKIREGIKTEYGPRDAVDLRVQTIDETKTRLFSGFAAGIVGQVSRMEAGNLPAVCRIVKTDTQRGATRGLELVRPLPAGVDLVSIAKALPVPIAPVAVATQTDDIPY